MRAANVLVFDEYLQASTGSPTPVYTDQALNDRLGSFDMLALMAVVDDVSGSGNINIYVQHSADGRNWVSKVVSGGTDVPQITVSSLSAGQNSYPGYDDGSMPSLAFVRLRTDFSTSTSAAAHVRVYVTGRILGGR
jgi:hypothetical protein